MDSLNIDINNMVLRLQFPISKIRAKNIVNNAINILEETIKNHTFEYSYSLTGFHIDTLNIPTISIKKQTTDKEIAKSIAYELYKNLIKQNNF
jgi:hypothetical protein